MIVTFSGKCATFRVAGQNLPCRAVKYFHGQGGRAYFTIAIDDPTDKGHILSFSGEKARREKNDFYELTIDQMLLNSKERPRVNAVRVPLVKQANGICRQFGDIEKKRITAVSCVATDKDGLKYELQFEADGEPALVQTIVREPAGTGKAPQAAAGADGLQAQGDRGADPAARFHLLHHPVPGGGRGGGGRVAAALAGH